MYNKIIGIIYGGYSSENQISKLSCDNIFNVLKDNYKNLFKVEISHDRWVVYDKNNVSYFINKKEFSFVINSKLKKFDLVINMIHGSPGEDGEFTKYLNKLNIRNNSLTPDIARLTQDKFNCNMKAKSIGINTPSNIKLKNNNDLKLIYDKIKFPCFVKPNSSDNCRYFFGDLAFLIDFTNSSLILSLLTPFKLGFILSAFSVSLPNLPPSAP